MPGIENHPHQVKPLQLDSISGLAKLASKEPAANTTAVLVAVSKLWNDFKAEFSDSLELKKVIVDQDLTAESTAESTVELPGTNSWFKPEMRDSDLNADKAIKFGRGSGSNNQRANAVYGAFVSVVAYGADYSGRSKNAKKAMIRDSIVSTLHKNNFVFVKKNVSGNFIGVDANEQELLGKVSQKLRDVSIAQKRFSAAKAGLGLLAQAAEIHSAPQVVPTTNQKRAAETQNSQNAPEPKQQKRQDPPGYRIG